MFYRYKFVPLLVAAALTVASSPAAAQNTSKTPPIPPPGQLVDLGGWHLHLNCAGEGSAGKPTVILEAGAGGFSVDWSLVQPEVVRFARVCSYDRAGLGWRGSKPGPHIQPGPSERAGDEHHPFTSGGA